MEAAPATALQVAPARLAIAHAANAYRRYPGETVTFHTRVDVLEAVPGFTVQVRLDRGLTPGDAICTTNGQVPRVVLGDDGNHFLWELDGENEAAAGQRYEFAIEALVAATEADQHLSSQALALVGQGEGRNLAGGEEVTIVVAAKSRYLKYLPAFYEEDELMGRFLMLFESFWEPINGRVNQMAYYFDPKYAPADLLPWLASWIGLNLDERWPADRRRLMLSSAVTLFRRRGTKRGLQDYLEVFTGQKPQIIEHGANNFRIGRDARLGPSIALGTGNRPHTFQVILKLPPIADAPNEEERARREEQRRRMIVAIIDSEKPAHTDYALQLEVAEA
jgi:phage tail-like protein